MKRTQPPTNRACSGATPGPRGFTLLEVMIAVAIVGILAALAYASFRNVPRSAKVSSGVLELTGELQNAKGQADARDQRVAVLLYAAPGQPIRYWTVLDPWMTLDDSMAATPSWTKPDDLRPLSPPAPANSRYRVLESGALDPVVTFASGGYRGIVSAKLDNRCSAYTVVLASGTGGGGGYFPPPFCFVPDDKGCTFCSTAASATRGAVAFEPEGRARLFDGKGMETPAGAGSLAFSAPDLPTSKGVAVTFTPSGLVRTFRGPK